MNIDFNDVGRYFSVNKNFKYQPNSEGGEEFKFPESRLEQVKKDDPFDDTLPHMTPLNPKYGRIDAPLSLARIIFHEAGHLTATTLARTHKIQSSERVLFTPKREDQTHVGIISRINNFLYNYTKGLEPPRDTGVPDEFTRKIQQRDHEFKNKRSRHEPRTNRSGK